MNRKGFSTILLIAGVAIVAVSLFFIVNNTNLVSTFMPGTITSNNGEVSYTSTIRNIDTSCGHDGVCKVLIGKYWIITDLGGDPNQEMENQRGARGKMFLVDGTQRGTLGGDEITGMKAEVFALKTGKNELSLYGSDQYYIKLLSK